MSKDTPPANIYTLSLHDALPISPPKRGSREPRISSQEIPLRRKSSGSKPAAAPCIGSNTDRKSTRLNSSHRCISYAVFCLKKKKSTKELQIGTNEKAEKTDTSIS